MRDELALAIGFVLAGLGPLVVTTLLSPLRDQTHGSAVVIFVLILVVATSAAFAGPGIGAVATMTAVLSFNFLFIRPYLVLKFDQKDELWPVVVLLAAGVSIVVVTRRRRTRSARFIEPFTESAERPSKHIQRIVQLVDEGVDPRDLISAVQAELTGLLLARSCRFTMGEDIRAMPRLERDGLVSGWRSEVEFPDQALALPVRTGGHCLGCFVIDPTPDVLVPRDRRIVAVILTDHLAGAIASRNPTVPPRT